MNEYESIFITNPNITPGELSSVVDTIKTNINRSNGEIVIIRHWGKKRLAYPIKKFNEGIYIYIRFNGEGDCVENLEELYRSTPSIIRFLTTKLKKRG